MALGEFSLAGKVAIVTGGSRGIGRAVAVGLAEAGADVALVARRPDPLVDAVDAVKATGRRGLAVPANIRDMDSLGGVVERVEAELGRVDVLVNNAATNPVFGAVQDIDERAWDAIMNTNVKAAFFLSKYVREAILRHGEGGSIVNVSSGAGLRASEVLGGYGVSKAALGMLTQVCAKQWGTDGIRVNCIAPGLVKTDFSQALWSDEKILSQSTKGSALRRIGLPEEMAGAVVYFASAASSFVTGQTLSLDGGTIL